MKLRIDLKNRKINELVNELEVESREQVINCCGRELTFHSAGGGAPVEGGVDLLIKNCNGLSTKTLLVECGQGAIEEALTKNGAAVTSYHTNFVDFNYTKKNGFENAVFGEIVTSSLNEKFDFAIFKITKSSIYNQLAVSKILSLLNSTGKLWIFGATKEGIKGVSSKLKKAGIIQTVVDNGNRNRIIEISGDNSFEIAYETKETIYSVDNKEVSVTTTPGLFSYGKVDRGTELLLNFFPKCGKRSVLDLGCGSGVLSKLAIERGAQKVVAVDVSIIGVEAAKKNLLGLGNVKVVGGYMTDSLDEKFDVILTKPPFHEGGTANYSIGEEWLDSLEKKLTRKGEIWLVANLFLPYRTMAEKRFGVVETVIEKDGFRVFKIRKWK